MQGLTDDLLLLARNGNAGALRLELVDLDDLVLGEARRIRPAATVEVATTGVSAAQVRGDARGLSRAIRNVIENAVRYARSRVVVELSEQAGLAVLTITDDGPGIPPADKERVFERFARADAARGRDGGGAGLGLAIARAILESHGGDIKLDPGHPRGARFVLTIPSAAGARALPRPQRATA